MERVKSRNECIEDLRKRGFTEDFGPSAEFGIHYIVSNKTYRPHELRISAFYHCVEEKEEKEDSVVYAIETNDGKKGILIDNNREFLDDRVSEFIHVVNMARQRSKRYKFLLPVQWLFRIPFSTN
jgi:hypothetical protein